MDKFFEKQNPSIARNRQATQIQTNKKWQASSGKKDSSEDILHISFNHS